MSFVSRVLHTTLRRVPAIIDIPKGPQYFRPYATAVANAGELSISQRSKFSYDELAPLPIMIPDTTRDFHLYVKSTRNNTLMSLVGKNKKNGQLGTYFFVSGGTAGFKNVQRSGYEAGYQCAIKMFQRIKQEKEVDGPMRIHLYFNGFGQGREAVFRALTASDGEEVRMMVSRITDRTPIKIGGTRAKKRRVL